MAANKLSIPKGTRDFSPVEMLRRNYIFNTIKEVYQLYGFEQIETPAMENLSTLLGKYGDEGDKLLFRILNSGDFKARANLTKNYNEYRSIELADRFCERGLRYDLTVPFARYVVQHQNEISFPFRRYQIQPVWRADRPQKGRYREFYQCDADIIGSTSLLNELELVQIVDEVFNRLDVKVVIKFNNRKLLSGIAEIIKAPDKIIDITVAIDKLDKIGIERVREELSEKGLGVEQIEKLNPLFEAQGAIEEKVSFLKEFLMGSQIGESGIQEVEELLLLLKNVKIKNEVELDLTLARGLNYYTGAIFEVKAKDVQIGSICGGGRYDDLTGIFGLKDVSGVGISFGADRIYDVLLQLEKFPQETSESTQMLFINFGGKEIQYCLPIVTELRQNGIRTEIFPDNAKMKKQMNYANNKNIPFVVLVGENEMKENSVTIKNMNVGEQTTVSKNEIIKYFSS